MADKKKVLLDDDWNKRIEKAIAANATSKKKTVKKPTAKKKKK